MGYIAILVALLLGGGFAYQQLVVEEMSVTPLAESTEESIFDAITEAEKVKDILEGEQDTSSDVDTAEESDESDRVDSIDAMIDTRVPETIVVDDEDAMVAGNVVVADIPDTIRTMLVAGGCFWCVESDLEKLPGVIEAVSGYAGGSTADPTYKNYEDNGHREVVEVTFNPMVVSFEEILISVIKHTDPTDDDGSFADRGDYYSTAFYYETAAEKKIIESLITEIDTKGPYDASLAIDIEKRPTFYEAERYHQNYYKGLSALKYKYYRSASGRDDFIEKYWGTDTSPNLSWRNTTAQGSSWSTFVKPSDASLLQELTALQYKVTQKNGTEKSFNNEYWDNHEDGIYVDIVSGEPLFSSTNKFDSGTGWPSFTRPIEYNMVTEESDYKLIIKRTEVRSKIADSHLGHIFNDAPAELGGIRYCINSASLRFVAKEDMETEGYGEFLNLF